METTEITLLLVGSTGNGKSATGNSILRQQAFKATASTSVTNSEIGVASCSFKDIKINVLDCPGIETDKSAEEVLNLALRNIKQALELGSYTFSALVIVLKYGARFTKQESHFLKIIKGILGENVIRKFGVCIMTHGDNFEYDNEDEHANFGDWCTQQEGDIKNLFEECNYRCVLFNNRTKDESLKDLQITQLIAKVPEEQQYDEEKFKAANSGLQKLIIETKMPIILKQTQDFLEVERNKIRTMKSDEDINKQIQIYKDILNEANEFEQKLSDNSYGADIQQPINEIKNFKMDVGIKLRYCEQRHLLEPSESLIETQSTGYFSTFWNWCCSFF